MATDNHDSQQIPVIILAAGNSERMVQPKPFMKWDEHTTFLEKIVSEYTAIGAGRIIIVMNKAGYVRVNAEVPQITESANIIVNEHPEKGRMSSLKLGLQSIPGNTSSFIQNIDNPFVNAALLRLMIPLDEPDAYVVPVCNGKGGHPVLTGSKIVEHILADESDDSDFRLMLKNFRRKEVETDDKFILVNINTPEDYQLYFNRNKMKV